jgi:hypothetical protein
MRHHQRPNSLVSPIPIDRFPSPSQKTWKRRKKRIMIVMDRFSLSTPQSFFSLSSPDLHDPRTPGWHSPSNLAQSGKLPTSKSRRFTGRHKRVSSERHGLRHYDHRFGEPWNGWKDWKDFVLRGKKEQEKSRNLLAAFLSKFRHYGFPVVSPSLLWLSYTIL